MHIMSSEGLRDNGDKDKGHSTHHTYIHFWKLFQKWNCISDLPVSLELVTPSSFYSCVFHGNCSVQAKFSMLGCDEYQQIKTQLKASKLVVTFILRSEANDIHFHSLQDPAKVCLHPTIRKL